MKEAAPVPTPLLLYACALGTVLALLGALIALGCSSFGAAADPTVPGATNFYLYTFTRYEPLPLFLAATFLGGVTLMRRRSNSISGTIPLFLLSKNLPWLVAFLVLTATGVGRFEVHQNFDLSIDEYLNDFEAPILEQGKLRAEVPQEWRSYAPAMRVPYQNYNATTGTWASGFLPGFAGLDFIFGRAGLDWAVSPVLAALSVLLLAAVARRIFPAQSELAANLAVLMMALSPQFLAMALTKFAWTAQLCGALLWLWFYLHPQRIFFLLTPILGALLIGLHQPHVHPLVAAPFVLRLAWEKRWRDFLWFSAVYLVGAFCWYQVFVLLRPSAGTAGDLGNIMGTSGFSPMLVILTVLFAALHAVTLLAWTFPLVPALVVIFLITWREQPMVIRDGFYAVMLTFLFYLTFPHPQGHGWGFRYLHAAYGLIALAATGGMLATTRQEWFRVFAAAAIFVIAVQVPYRAWEISSIVRPFALVSGYISRQDGLVIVDTRNIWYAQDLIRNDPWLQKKPFVFNNAELTTAQREELKQRGRVVFVDPENVKPFGAIVADPAKAPSN